MCKCICSGGWWVLQTFVRPWAHRCVEHSLKWMRDLRYFGSGPWYTKQIYLFIYRYRCRERDKVNLSGTIGGAPLRHIQTSEMMKDENCFFIRRRIFSFSLFSVDPQFVRANYVQSGLPSAQTHNHTHTHDSMQKKIYGWMRCCARAISSIYYHKFLPHHVITLWTYTCYITVRVYTLETQHSTI